MENLVQGVSRPCQTLHEDYIVFRKRILVYIPASQAQSLQEDSSSKALAVETACHM